MTSQGGHERASSQRGAIWLAAGAVLAALVLRFVGIGALLPHRPAGDERVWAGQMQLLRGPIETAQMSPRYGFYPHLLARLALLVQPEFEVPRASNIDEHRRAASRDLVVLRGWSAALSALAPLATFLLARRFMPPFPAALAAWLAATSLLATWYSPQARPHGAAVALVVLGVWSATLVRRRGDVRAYLLAGAILAGAVSILQNGFLLLAPLLVAHMARKGESRRRGWLGLALALGLTAVAVRVFYPFAFLDAQPTANAGDALGGHHLLGQAFLSWDLFDGSGARVLAETFWSLEPLSCALFVAAAGLLVARFLWRDQARTPAYPSTLVLRWRRALAGRADVLIVLSFALPYLLAFSAYSLTFPRYLLHLLPFAAIFSVYEARGAATWLERRFSPAAWPRRAAWIAAVGLVLAQTSLCAKLAWLRTQPDTLARAAEFLRANASGGRARAVTFADVDLPLLREADSMTNYRVSIAETWGPPWAAYQSRRSEADRSNDALAGTAVYPLYTLDMRTNADPRSLEVRVSESVRALAPCWFVIDAADLERHNPLVAGLLTSLSRGLAARFSPMKHDDGDERPFLFRDQNDEWRSESSWAWRLLGARALGPVLEIHAVDS